jgi:putative transposase
MTMTDDKPEVSAEQAAVQQLVDAGLLDELMARVDEGGLQLTGEGGFLPAMIKAVLERGLQAELSGHLGYEKGDPAGRGSPNSGNGSTPKTVATEVGDIALATPRDARSRSSNRSSTPGASQPGWSVAPWTVAKWWGVLNLLCEGGAKQASAWPGSERNSAHDNDRIDHEA